MSKAIYEPNYLPSEVEARTAKPQVLAHIIKEVLKASETITIVVTEGGEERETSIWYQMERHLSPPGVCGSRSFDQANVVRLLLMADTESEGLLTKAMEAKNISQRLLWDRLQAVLRQMGFRVKHGRLIGFVGEDELMLDEDGQPDVD